MKILGFFLIIAGVVMFRFIPAPWHLTMWVPIWIGIELYSR